MQSFSLGKEQEEVNIEALKLLRPGLDSVSLSILSLCLPSWPVGLLTVSTHRPHSGLQVGCVSLLRADKVTSCTSLKVE